MRTAVLRRTFLAGTDASRLPAATADMPAVALRIRGDGLVDARK